MGRTSGIELADRSLMLAAVLARLNRQAKPADISYVVARAVTSAVAASDLCAANQPHEPAIYRVARVLAPYGVRVVERCEHGRLHVALELPKKARRKTPFLLLS